MRPQNVYAAAAQRRRPLLHYLVALLFMNRIRQRMRRARRLLRCRSRQVGTIHRNAAGKNKLLDPGIGRAIVLGNRFHHPRRARHIDLPHPLRFKHARAHRINHKCEVNHRNRPRVAQQFVEHAGAGFVTQIHALKLQRQIGLRRTHVHPDHREISQQREQPRSQVSRDASDHDSRFCALHQFGLEGGAGCAEGCDCEPAAGAAFSDG